MTEQKNLLFDKNAYAIIKGAKRVDCLTNTSYVATARKADERIKKNNLSMQQQIKNSIFYKVIK